MEEWEERAGVKRAVKTAPVGLSGRPARGFFLVSRRFNRNSHTDLPVTLRCEQVHSLYVLPGGGSPCPQEFGTAPINCLLLK